MECARAIGGDVGAGILTVLVRLTVGLVAMYPLLDSRADVLLYVISMRPLKGGHDILTCSIVGPRPCALTQIQNQKVEYMQSCWKNRPPRFSCVQTSVYH